MQAVTDQFMFEILFVFPKGSAPSEPHDITSQVPTQSFTPRKSLLRGIALAGVILALRFAVPVAVVAAEQAAGSSGLVGLVKGK